MTTPPTRPNDIGRTLRDRREELNLTLAEIGQVLRIRAEYLAALEQNDVSRLPGPAYATGFLRAYADYLGFDGRETANRFKLQSGALQEQQELSFPMPLTDRGVPAGRIVVLGLILAALGYGSWSWYSSATDRSVALVEPVPERLLPPPAPPAPALQSAAPAPVSPDTTAVADPTAAPAGQPQNAAPPVSAPPATQTAAAPPPPAAVGPADTPQIQSPEQPHVFGKDTPGAVVVRATADTWVEVLDNNRSIWSRLLRPGDVYNPPKDGLVLRTGNAGGIEITVAGKTLPAPGKPGEVRRIPLDAASLQGG